MDKLRELVATNPEYGYLMVCGGLVIVLIGVIMDADWVLEPGGGYFNIAYWTEKIGRKNMRLIMGSALIFAIICCLGLYFYYTSKASPQ